MSMLVSTMYICQIYRINIIMFSQKKAFLIFPEIKPSTFQLKLKEIKENTPQENF